MVVPRVVLKCFSDDLAGPLSGRLPDEPCAFKGKSHERWFFINGICTDRRVAAANVRVLQTMFRRPITVLHNATEGLVPDLLECAIGKEWDSRTEAIAALFPFLLQALQDRRVERVVLLAHSQGTILTAVMLKLLESMLLARKNGHRGNTDRFLAGHPMSQERRQAQQLLGEWPGQGVRVGSANVRPVVNAEQIRKLEVYCFANCASSMEAFITGDSWAAPYIESYANEFDVVGRLGLLAAGHGIGSSRITGDRFVRPKTWGHLLNAHYLPAFARDMNPGGPLRIPRLNDAELVPMRGNVRERPRLFGYADGWSPPTLR